jgi:hypothetical protein
MQQYNGQCRMLIIDAEGQHKREDRLRLRTVAGMPDARAPRWRRARLLAHAEYVCCVCGRGRGRDSTRTWSSS